MQKFGKAWSSLTKSLDGKIGLKGEERSGLFFSFSLGNPTFVLSRFSLLTLACFNFLAFPWSPAFRTTRKASHGWTSRQSGFDLNGCIGFIASKLKTNPMWITGIASAGAGAVVLYASTERVQAEAAENLGDRVAKNIEAKKNKTASFLCSVHEFFGTRLHALHSSRSFTSIKLPRIS